MFHSFFSTLARSVYMFIFSLSFISTLWSTGTAKPTKQKAHYFLLIKIGSGLLVGIIRSVCISKPKRVIIIAAESVGIL